MITIQILLAIIVLPVALHLLRILIVPSPGHSFALSPIVAGTSGLAVVGLLSVFAAMAFSGNFDPLNMPQRPDLQRDTVVLNQSYILPF